jgi:hypothetical protein
MNSTKNPVYIKQHNLHPVTTLANQNRNAGKTEESTD